MKCLILAGGFGTKLCRLALNRVRARLEYEGKPLLTPVVNKVLQDIGILVYPNRIFKTGFRH